MSHSPSREPSSLTHTSSPHCAWLKIEKWNKGAETIVKIPLFKKKLLELVHVRKLSELRRAGSLPSSGFKDDNLLRGQETCYLEGRDWLYMSQIHPQPSDKSPHHPGRREEQGVERSGNGAEVEELRLLYNSQLQKWCQVLAHLQKVQFYRHVSLTENQNLVLRV